MERGVQAQAPAAGPGEHGLAGGGRPPGMPADYSGNQWPPPAPEPARNDGKHEAPASEGFWARFISAFRKRTSS